MKIGNCKTGDIVWFFNNVCKDPVLIRVLDDCTDWEFLMPRKKMLRLFIQNTNYIIGLENYFMTYLVMKPKKKQRMQVKPYSTKTVATQMLKNNGEFKWKKEK